MLRDAAVARVKQLLGFRTDNDANIVQAMKEVQEEQELEAILPDFLRKQYDIAYVTTISDHVLDVPDDFIREWDEDQLNVTLSDGTIQNLVKDELGYLRIRYTDSGLPVRYALINRQFYFYPLPDAEYVVSGTYYAHDALLNTNIENKWLANMPDLLISGAGLLIAAAMRDKDALALFSAMQTQAKNRINVVTTANDAAGSKPVIGGDN